MLKFLVAIIIGAAGAFHWCGAYAGGSGGNEYNTTNNNQQYGGNSTSVSGAHAIVDNAATSNATGGNATANGGRSDSNATVLNNTSNVSTNVSTNLSTNAQGQQQGQKQGQSQSTNSSANSSNDGNAQSVTFEGSERAYRNVASAYSSDLSASTASAINGTCFGSASGGVQTGIIGVSIGSTVKDDHCDTRYNAYALKELGHKAAAAALLCQQVPGVAEAMAAAGTPCPKQAAVNVSVSASPIGGGTIAAAAPEVYSN